jgi:hypothetical protein
MDENPTPGQVPGTPPRRLLGGLSRRAATAVVAGGLMTGGVVGGVLIANAASTSATTAASTASPSPGMQTPPQGGQPRGDFDPTKGGHVGANGVVETLLTGDTADKVFVPATAAVPGATIERVENDAEGSPYEAHMVKSDGTHVTVKVDSGFKVTSVDADRGGPHGGQPGA